MEVSLRKLTYLVTAARLGSLSSAADQLNVSQPALSRSIAELEKHYGVRIFERSRSGVVLTWVGEQIVVEADRILQGAKKFDRKYRLVGRGEGGHLSIGVGPFVAGIFLPELVRAIFAQNPSAEVSSLIRPGDVLIDALLESSIELFISPMDDRQLPPQIVAEKVAHFPLKMVARPAVNGHQISRS